MRRYGESPAEPWRHAPVLNRGAFDSPNQYLQEEQHLFYGGALVRPGAGLGRRRTPPKFTYARKFRRQCKHRNDGTALHFPVLSRNLYEWAANYTPTHLDACASHVEKHSFDSIDLLENSINKL